MTKHLFIVVLVILVPTVCASRADVPDASRREIEETISPHASGGAISTCSIAYYDLCHYTWIYGGMTRWHEVGVVFDLPLDCDKLPGEQCVNTGFWWYWRYTQPGRGYAVTYRLYGVDANGCKAGAPLGTLASQVPTERWNHYPGLGGALASDRVAFVASWMPGPAPALVTDNNVRNQADPVNCPGYVPHTVAHSMTWKDQSHVYCPPVPFTDALGPVEIVMDAGFTCGPTATESGSWSGVKRLFR